MSEAKDAARARVRIEAEPFDGSLVIDQPSGAIGVRIPCNDVRVGWGIWSVIESAVRRLKPLTAQEWAVLESLAVAPASQRGLTELKSALERTSAV